MMELTEKRQKEQTQAYVLESTILFDAEVNTQVAKLTSSTQGTDADSSGHWIIMTNNPVDNGQSPGLSAVDANDFAHEQKIAIQEERAMYLEFFAEHDNLLAWQDLEEASLHAAIARVAGQEADDECHGSCGGNGVHQFGKYVKLT
jgi:hypothetical protein